MESVCRLCAKEKPLKQLVHSIADQNIQQILIDCCRWNFITTTGSETLPKKICNPCYRKLQMSWSFAENIARAQQQISSMFLGKNPVSPSIDGKGESIAANKQHVLEAQDGFNESHQENIDPRNDDKTVSSPNVGTIEPTSNKRPKRQSKPAQEKYQAGNIKAKSKGKKPPNKKIDAKIIVPEKQRRPLQKLPTSKRNICTKCGKEFIEADSLKRHSKIHMEEKRHECRTCGKRFRTKDKLNQHDNIHTGNKPYGCQYCAYRSGHYSNYLIHLRRKHGLARKTQHLITAGEGGGLRMDKYVTFYEVDKY